MKIRTVNELQDRVDKESAWRRQELSGLLMDVKRAKGCGDERRHVRAAVALLYAHWEGWIKATATLYLQYLNGRKLSYIDLPPGLLGASLRTQLDNLHGATQSRSYAEFAEFVRNQFLAGPKQNAKWSDTVAATHSNLNSDRLRSLLHSLELDESPYELKYALIDSQLLQKRNSIAHGQYESMDAEEYLNLHSEVLELLGRFQDDILNAAMTEGYLARPSANTSR